LLRFLKRLLQFKSLILTTQTSSKILHLFILSLQGFNIRRFESVRQRIQRPFVGSLRVECLSLHAHLFFLCRCFEAPLHENFLSFKLLFLFILHTHHFLLIFFQRLLLLLLVLAHGARIGLGSARAFDFYIFAFGSSSTHLVQIYLLFCSFLV